MEPYRVVFAEGGLYVVAQVPRYGEVRTFAVERIQRLALTDQRFTRPTQCDDLFPHSLGVYSGTPEHVEIEFDPQVVRRLTDGRIRLELHVTVAWVLRRWVLGFGSHARVVGPAALADDNAR